MVLVEEPSEEGFAAYSTGVEGYSRSPSTATDLTAYVSGAEVFLQAGMAELVDRAHVE